MNVSYEWLKAFVDFPHSPAELRDLLTAHVATVDDLVALRADLAPIVVARVVEARRHPNSDHLWVTKVDAGGTALLDVVCGAPNVQAGRLYPFAPTGTVMPDGLKIEKRKIRGETSNGMLCSARELGLGQDHDGILELSVAAEPGTPFLRAMPVGDSRLVVDVLPNRPDLLSHVGFAREIAAVTGLPLSLPAIPGAAMPTPAPTDVVGAAVSLVDAQLATLAADLERITRVVESNLGIQVPRPGALAAAISGDGLDVAVEHPLDAPRYVGTVIRGVTIGPSPEWLVARLEAVGSRSINNVVDATNYVMHELGQPLHAFDLRKLAGGRVLVRRARAGETIRTLDGIERRLDPEMTVIADAARPQAVAGVMGGAESEVGETTRDLFLESASFDARRTRATRRKLGLSTDASYRFERGVDPELARVASERAVAIITAVAGGVAEEPRDLYPVPLAQRSVLLRPARVALVLGEPIASVEIGRWLGGVGFGVSPSESGDALRVSVPSWRTDVTAEINLIEEVARLRGYDRASATLRPYRPGRARDDALAVSARRIRSALAAAGLFEARPMPFVAAPEHESAQAPRVLNPLAETEAYLRASVLATLARRAEYNLAQMEGNVRLFEIGSVFARGEGAMPREAAHAALLVMGERRPAHFTDANHRAPIYDLWDAKALAELLLEAAFPGACATVRPAAENDGGLLWELLVDDEPRGRVQRVTLDAPVWAAPAFGVEVMLAPVDSAPAARADERVATGVANAPTYKPLPTTPAAGFDVALLVPDVVAAADVEAVIRQAGGDLLERVVLLSEFRGEGIPAGTRSLAWRLTFRHPERTLGGKEVEGRRERMLRILESRLGVRTRG